eukprot:scaffold1388_cov267-Chaetoceros_neogracile.AAC.18
MRMTIFPSILLGLIFSSIPTVNAINVGDSIPSVELHHNFPPEKIDLADRLANKNVDALKKVGVDEVIIYCVNDGAVMMAWAEDQGVKEDSMVTLMGDPYGALTSALEMEMTHAGPASVGITGRCKRFALYVENGIVKILRVAEAEDDPAGDDRPEVTLAEAMVDAIKALKLSDEL